MSDEATRTMGSFHCEMLELSLRFKSEDIDQDAFLKAAGVEDKAEYVDEDGDLVMALTFNEHEQSTDYHAHMRVLFFKNGHDRIDLKYHQADTRSKTEDDKPPYAEDCAQWLGNFFKVDKVSARMSAAYTLDNSFAPVLNLPFPLISSEKALAGSLITGLSILFPKEKGTETVVLQTDATDDNEMVLLFNALSELNLKQFDLLDELTRLSVRVNSLVRKQENSRDT